ncbi:hypothetical protein [Moritella sp. F3]|uniref:hypothetical protein n=1 Tax=Moritella sp. F3 TaxID=2718882 RepID=UPI0018E0D83B|nr:hypothetical protein [Moritella sp. F3]GIC76717.1 hypothetical protein FMO001_14440 [Moritella sp. F1]GIC80267.1 hypothetical protein FMO003_05480 [Moritella sp. F3]
MLLEQLIEIIEFTDSDSLADALQVFNHQGIIANSALPYLAVVFDNAPTQLCHKLKQVGFKGDIDIKGLNTDSKGQCYAVYDTNRFNAIEAQGWLEANSN